MRTIYLRKEDNLITRKVLLDMAYLVSHKKIRLPKYQLEEGLYLLYLPDVKEKSRIEKYFLTRDKIFSEDNYHYYFKFPFKADQVTETAY
ncbi:MAG: hypothetical protein IPM56_10635 [Ignavibacteriales bacterium]|nr:MAG: hypothetical protein IPM56_10635 [Ignavibacteriales bacterium]